MFLGRRGYYLDKAYKNEPSFGRSALKHMVDNAVSEEKFKKFMKSMGVTHILMRTDLVDKYLRDNFTLEEIGRFMNLAEKCWKTVYEHNGYAVWDIQHSR